MTGAFDRPDAHAARVSVRDAQRLSVTTSVRADHGLTQHRSRRCDNDRERVLIAVRVDTDHVVHLVCKHPDRSSVRSKGPMTPV